MTGILIIAIAICWAVGLLEFTYPSVVPNEPLLHPQKVRNLDGTNMVLESGEIIALSPRYSSDRSAQEVAMDISNHVSRGGFEVDVEPKNDRRVEIYVRWPRKFRDSAPPFTIPIIPQRVGRLYRKSVAFGMHSGTNSHDVAANSSQPVRSGTNRESAAASSRRSP
jgi:hypothetical protein